MKLAKTHTISGNSSSPTSEYANIRVVDTVAIKLELALRELRHLHVQVVEVVVDPVLV